MENARHIFDSAGVSGTGVETVAPLKFDGTNNPRHLRILAALMLGPVRREEIDRIAGASNGPDEVAGLRKKGLGAADCLKCKRHRRVDRDGRVVQPGTYTLTDEGGRRVLDWLAREGATIAELLARVEKVTA